MPLLDEQHTNGRGLGPSPADAADFRAAEAELKVLELGILTARSNFLRQIGVTHEGQRDLWGVFGYPRVLTTRQYVETYARGGIAGRIVDTFPNATWRGEVELIEDEDPDVNTLFEQAWQDLDQRLQIQAKLQRVDKLAGLSTYAVLLIGAPGELSQELPKVNNAPEKLLYLQPFLGGGGPAASTAGSSLRTEAADADCTIAEYVTDAKDPRFGLPQTYQLRRTEVASPDFQKPVHWTRVIHIAEGLLSDDVFGQPALERVWNLLQDLEKVTAGGAEAFWLRANQGLHLDVNKDMTLPDAKATIESLKEQADAYRHQLTRWLRTRGVSVETLGSDVANFANPADAILTQIAGAKGIPKRVLTGSEMGELASSQDRENFKDQINGRQTGYAGPYIVRPLVDRLIAYGYLPTPRKGPLAYEVRWPHIQVLTEQEKADGAQKWAQTNQTQGEPVFTDAEIRDHWYFMAPLTDEQRAEIDERKKAALEMQAEAMAAMAPAAKGDDEKPGAKKVLPFKARAAEESEDAEILRVLEAAILADNEAVVSAIVGVTHQGTRALGDVPGHPFHGNQYTSGEGGSSRTRTKDEFDPAHAYVDAFLQSKTGLLETRPSAAQAQKLHQLYSAIESALTDPDIGMEVYAAITSGGSAETFRRRIDDLESGRAIIHGGTGESPFILSKPGKAGQPVIRFKAAETAHERVIAVLRAIAEALENPETREFTEQLLKDVASLRTAGGPGSGNFGHRGRPGEVGGSASDGRDAFPGRSSRRDPFPEWSKSHPPTQHTVGSSDSDRAGRPRVGDPEEIVRKLRVSPADQERAETWVNATLDDDETHFNNLSDEQIRQEFAAWKEQKYGRRHLGGPGSGNFGHAGRPGEVGGSAPASGPSADDDEMSTDPGAPRGDSLSTPVPHSGHTKKLGQGGINGAEKLTTEDGKNYLFKPSGSEHWIFGPTVFQDGSGDNPTGARGANLGERETLASRTAKEMGFSIPEAHYGRVPGEQAGAGAGVMREGAVIDFVEGAEGFFHETQNPMLRITAPDRAAEKMATFSEQERAKQVIFDTVIGNVDRHRGNFMVKDNSLVSIDHGYSFGRTYPKDQSPHPELEYFDQDLAQPLPVHSSMRNIAVVGLSDSWLSRDEQQSIAHRLETMNWKHVLKGSKLSTEERRALKLRTDRVVERLKAGQLGKLAEDFSWKTI